MMTKADLIAAVAEMTGLSKAEAEAERKAAYCETRDVRLQPIRDGGAMSSAWMDDEVF